MVAPLVFGIGLGLSGLVGFIGGALSRQPEINELKSQVKQLQKEIERLHGVIRAQDAQIRELQIRYMALKGWQFVEKNKQKKYIRGCLMYKYALRDYLAFLIDADKSGEVRMNKEEVEFYNAFGNIICAGDITDKNRETVFNYISQRYSQEINRFEEPSFDFALDYLS